MNKKKEISFAPIKKSDWILIGLSWLLIQIIFLKVMGINNHEEADKYISLANHWIQGDGNFHIYNVFYSGYVSIYVLLKGLGLPDNSMYVIQLLVSALSTYYFVLIVRLFIHSRYVLVISGILYATCYVIQQWVRVLFTDSIFCSLLVIAVYFLMTLEKSVRNKRIFWILFLILPFFRPVGFLFILVACVHWAMISFRKNRGRLLLSTVYLALIGFAIYKSFSSEYYFFPIHSMHNLLGNVICGYPGDYGKYARVPYREGMSVFSYLFQNPEMTARLFVARFYKVFSMSRSYFSPYHNRLLDMSTLIYYLLAIIGIVFVVRRKVKALYFLLAGILIFSFPMVIFCVEWTGRFSLPVIFFVLIFSSIGIDRVSRYPSFLVPAQDDGVRP